MKKTQKVLVVLLCGALCAMIFSCASGGGGGGASAGGSAGEVVAGTWTWKGYAPEDKGDGDTSICRVVIAEEVIGGETVTTYSLSGTVTNALQYGLAECDIIPDAETLELLRTCSAISFKILGDGKRYNIEVPISAVKNWAFHVQSIATTEGQVEDISLPMRGFAQPSWNNDPVPFTRNLIEKIIFKTRNQSEGGLGDFAVKIWDLKLHM